MLHLLEDICTSQHMRHSLFLRTDGASVLSVFTKTSVESQSWLKAAEVVFASGRNDFGQLGDSTRHL